MYTRKWRTTTLQNAAELQSTEHSGENADAKLCSKNGVVGGKTNISRKEHKGNQIK